MKRRGTAINEYEYPVELVWRSIVGGKAEGFQSMDAEEYENAKPKAGTIYTRALDVKQNERAKMQFKTGFYTADWDIQLTSLGPCTTRVRIDATVVFRSIWTAALMRFGAGIRVELRSYMDDLTKKLEAYDEKYLRKR